MWNLPVGSMPRVFSCCVSALASVCSEFIHRASSVTHPWVKLGSANIVSPPSRLYYIRFYRIASCYPVSALRFTAVSYLFILSCHHWCITHLSLGRLQVKLRGHVNIWKQNVFTVSPICIFISIMTGLSAKLYEALQSGCNLACPKIRLISNVLKV